MKSGTCYNKSLTHTSRLNQSVLRYQILKRLISITDYLQTLIYELSVWFYSNQSQIGHWVLKNLGQKYPGSFILNPRSRLFILSMSSSVRLKSRARFSLILPMFSDLGMTAHPLCTPHRNTTWAGVTPYFLAISTTSSSWC